MKQLDNLETSYGRQRKQKCQKIIQQPTPAKEKQSNHMDQLVFKVMKMAQLQKQRELAAQLKNQNENHYEIENINPYDDIQDFPSRRGEAMCEIDGDTLATCEGEIDILLHDPIFPVESLEKEEKEETAVDMYSASEEHYYVKAPVHHYHYNSSTYSQAAWPGRRSSNTANHHHKLEKVARNMNEIITDLNEPKTNKTKPSRHRRSRSHDEKHFRNHRHKVMHQHNVYSNQQQCVPNHSPLPFESAYHSSTLGRSQRHKNMIQQKENDSSNIGSGTLKSSENVYRAGYKYYNGCRYELLPPDDHVYETIPGGDYHYQMPINAQNGHLVPPPLPPRPGFLMQSDPNLLAHEYLEILPDSDIEDDVFEVSKQMDYRRVLSACNIQSNVRDDSVRNISIFREPEYVIYGSRRKSSSNNQKLSDDQIRQSISLYDDFKCPKNKQYNRWMSPSSSRESSPSKYETPTTSQNTKKVIKNKDKSNKVNKFEKSWSERDLSKLRVSVYHHYTVDDVLESIQRVEVGEDSENSSDNKNRRQLQSNKKCLPKLNYYRGLPLAVGGNGQKETFF